MDETSSYNSSRVKILRWGSRVDPVRSHIEIVFTELEWHELVVDSCLNAFYTVVRTHIAVGKLEKMKRNQIEENVTSA